MSQILPVAKDGTTYALFILGQPRVDGVNFITNASDEFQVGIMERPGGYEAKAHKHPPRDLHIEGRAEFLCIESGKAEITVFDEDWNVLVKQIVIAGDRILLLAGGHAVTMLEPTRMVEVKQGPYAGDASSKTFRSAS